MSKRRDSMIALFAVGLLALASASAARACQGEQSIQVGVDWVNDTCAEGDLTDCYDVADSVMRSLPPSDICAGPAMTMYRAVAKDIRALMARLRKGNKRLAKIVAGRRAERTIQDQSRGQGNGETYVYEPPVYVPPPPLGCYRSGNGLDICP